MIAVHPGEILREELAERGLTQAAFAAEIGRPAQLVCEIVTGKKRITARTALDFADVLAIPARFWLHMQADWDLSVAKAQRGAK